MKKIYIDCDTIEELTEIKSMLDKFDYNGEKYIILTANLKGRIKDTVMPGTKYGYGKVENFKSILGIKIIADTSNFTPNQPLGRNSY